MSKFIFADNVSTTLASPVAPGDTTITLSSSTNLPALSAGQIFTITLLDAATQSVFEICYATAISGANLTVTRGREGTAANSWLVGDFAYGAVTAGELANFGQTSVNNQLSSTAVNVPADGSGVVSVSLTGYLATPRVGLTVTYATTPPGPPYPTLGVNSEATGPSGFNIRVTGGTGTVSVDWTASGS